MTIWEIANGLTSGALSFLRSKIFWPKRAHRAC